MIYNYNGTHSLSRAHTSTKGTNVTELKGSVKEPNISIYFFFSAHHSMVFYFRCSVYWWNGSVTF